MHHAIILSSYIHWSVWMAISSETLFVDDLKYSSQTSKKEQEIISRFTFITQVWTSRHDSKPDASISFLDLKSQPSSLHCYQCYARENRILKGSKYPQLHLSHLSRSGSNDEPPHLHFDSKRTKINVILVVLVCDTYKDKMACNYQYKNVDFCKRIHVGKTDFLKW